jgi:hypothetical protein
MENTKHAGRLAALAGCAGLSLLSPGAMAIGPIEVGGWELDFSGNINGFYTIADCGAPGGGGVVTAGLACGSGGEERDVDAIQTGLLPAWFGFGAKTSQNNFDIALKIGFQPGISTDAVTGNDLNNALGLNSSNFRQVFLEFGQDSWGKIKVGRDIGMFGADALLSDMTLLGVGTISDLATGGGNTTLGRIGTGYLYADWKAQISYLSPSWNGLSLAAGIFSPWGLAFNPVGQPSSPLSLSSDAFDQKADTPRFEGKLDYAWEGDFGGKVWVSGLYQNIKTGSGAFSDADSWGIDVGGKIGFGGFELLGYYYTGEAIGTTGYLWDAVAANGNERDSDGGYVQGTYKFPGWGTKVGLSWGVSNLDTASGESASTSLVDKNESWIIGVYHPLTDALTLTAEYTDTTAKAHNGNEADEKVLSLGAILFY